MIVSSNLSTAAIWSTLLPLAASLFIFSCQGATPQEREPDKAAFSFNCSLKLVLQFSFPQD